MDKETKEKWVAALRSGKYQQGRNQLKSTSNKFCCLGVLADCALDGEWSYDHGSYYFYSKQGPSFCSNSTIPPEILPTKQQYHLTRMNDFLEKSFEEIADYIEKEL